MKRMGMHGPAEDHWATSPPLFPSEGSISLQMHLTPLALSINASVISHRRLASATAELSEEIAHDCTVWIPVFRADGSLAALYAAAGSQPPPEGWALWQNSDSGSGQALSLDAYLTGDIVVEEDGSQQHVPIYGCDGLVRIVVSVSRMPEEERAGPAPEPVYERETVPHVPPAIIYRAVGRSGLLEFTADFNHSPAILRGLVASVAEETVARSWQPDEEVSACFACGDHFTLLRRRHHCRSCLRVVCGSCSKLHLGESTSSEGGGARRATTSRQSLAWPNLCSEHALNSAEGLAAQASSALTPHGTRLARRDSLTDPLPLEGLMGDGIGGGLKAIQNAVDGERPERRAQTSRSHADTFHCPFIVTYTPWLPLASFALCSYCSSAQGPWRSAPLRQVRAPTRGARAGHEHADRSAVCWGLAFCALLAAAIALSARRARCTHRPSRLACSSQRGWGGVG